MHVIKEVNKLKKRNEECKMLTKKTSWNKKFIITLLILIMILFISNISWANSAEPPSILIIVSNAPEDLDIFIGDGEHSIKANKSSKSFETYYTFYSMELQQIVDYTITVTTGSMQYEIDFDKPLHTYNNIYTLDLEDQSLTEGKLLSRSILLISTRIILTLIIEAIVFWVFGFRSRRSWVVFLIMNLATQGILNILLNDNSPIHTYLFIGLIFGEIIILIAELISFIALIKEHSRLKRILYVITANFLSLVVGGYLITVLPI